MPQQPCLLTVGQLEVGQQEAEPRRTPSNLDPDLGPSLDSEGKWNKPLAQLTHTETVLFLVQQEGKEPLAE